MTERIEGRGAAYREQMRRRAATEEVKLPSGAVFLLRRPNLQAFTLSGVLPVELASRLAKQQEQGLSESQAFASLSEAEQRKMIEFGRRIITHICVDPKVVENPVADDEIGFEDMDEADMQFLAAWANTSGGEAAEAARFRGEPGHASVAGARRKK